MIVLESSQMLIRHLLIRNHSKLSVIHALSLHESSLSLLISQKPVLQPRYPSISM